MADCLTRLLGLCCRPCSCERPEPWKEGTALQVQGRTVTTTQGTVRVRSGNVPQPGQRVLMTPGGQTAGARPQLRPQPLRPNEDVPVPLLASYDSPQRPGPNHTPATDEEGTFTGTGGGPWEAAMVLDDGQEVEVGSESVVDHQARTVRWVDTQRGGVSSIYQSESLVLPDRLISGGDGTVFFYEYQRDGESYGEERGIATSTRTLLNQPYDPEQPSTSGTSVSTGPVTGRLLRLIGDYVSHTGYEAEGGTLYATYRQSGETRRYAITPEGSYPYSGQSTYLVQHTQHAPVAGPDAPSWQSPDGRVSVTAGWRRDHALLTDHEQRPLVLIAYGQALSGGSWAACCGPVAEGEDKVPAPEPWILHESGEVVTRVTPDGKTAHVSREVFEAEILRVPVGTFRRFSALGTLFNTWPPQWAYAECGTDRLTEVRAVGLHDPWRDSVKGRPPKDTAPPHPAWWYWPARPRARPKTLPQGVPVAPLALALTDVYAAAGGHDGGGQT